MSLSSKFRRSRRGVIVTSWADAIHLARTYAYQLNRRHRVRGLPVSGGWVWMVERGQGRVYNLR